MLKKNTKQKLANFKAFHIHAVNINRSHDMCHNRHAHHKGDRYSRHHSVASHRDRYWRNNRNHDCAAPCIVDSNSHSIEAGRHYLHSRRSRHFRLEYWCPCWGSSRPRQWCCHNYSHSPQRWDNSRR